MIEGVKVSSYMNKQIASSGERGSIMTVMKRLAEGKTPRPKRLSKKEATAVMKRSRAGVETNLYAVPYGVHGFNIFFYRTGSDDEPAEGGGDLPALKLKQSMFKNREQDAHIWCIMLGSFDGGDELQEPNRLKHFEVPELAKVG